MPHGPRGIPRAFPILFAIAGCAEPRPTGLHEDHVVGGTPADDMEATVRLTNRWGGLCSGSLVAPKVVMTAKHCISRGTWGWQIGFGPGGLERPVDLADAILSEDGGAALFQNEDIAFGILEEEVLDVEPYPLPWDGDGLGPGDDVRLIGYGGTEEETYGRKLETTDGVFAVGEHEFTTSGNGVCGGDSGGTGLDASGVVVGIIVRGPEGCELPPPARGTALTRVEAWLDLAREAFDLTGACYPTGEEVCDGRDNDCNGTVDDDCDPMGTPCVEAESCASDRCEEVAGRRICTDECDPSSPAEGCGPDAHCLEVACDEGWCVAGGPGPGEPGAECEEDGDCASLRCATVGSCGELCQVGQGACAPGQVCLPSDDCDVGVCVDAALAPDGSRGLGEPCARNADCAGGRCLETEYGRYCSVFCDDEGACPVGYRCEEWACRRGDPGGLGDPCRSNADCASDVCAEWDVGNACAERCAEDFGCPPDTSCVELAGGAWCRPDRAPTGEPCGVNGDCQRGLCGRFVRGDYCTQVCDPLDPCPSGFECVQTTGDVSICARRSIVPSGGGCRTAGDGPRSAGWMLAVLGLALARRHG